MGFLDNVVLQALGYACAVLGVALAFRILRYPDLTPDGSFMIGAAVTAATAVSNVPVLIGTSLAVLAGVAAGTLTGALSAWLRVNRLLSGILTSMVCYSLGFRILGGRSNLGLLDCRTVLSGADVFDADPAFRALQIHPGAVATSGAIVVIASLIAFALLKSDLGLVLRATGANEPLVMGLARRPTWYRFLGLGAANGLVALSAVLVTSAQGFADVNMGVGVIIVFIAALVLGEQGLRTAGFDPAKRLGVRVLASSVGALLYFLLFLLMLRASTRGWLPFRIEPTDLKLLSAVLVAAVYLLRVRSSDSEEVLPL